ncbi:GntR family transcriptional regulator [Flavobacterium sp. P21]|uniref:GntR family transcriptional regulator n=1 Tax=Flavobacterium sp. P21 TaxID=3423948 RepID=UPI003D66698F
MTYQIDIKDAMLPYKNLIVFDKNKGLPIYKQISLELILLIQQGKLQPGTLSPSTRSLAFDLQVHRKTIIAAYDLLIAEHWVSNLPRKRYTVSAILPVIKPRSYNSKRLNSFAVRGSFDFEPVPTFIDFAIPSAKSTIIINDGYPDPSLLPTNAIIKHVKKQFEYVASEANSVGTHESFSRLTVALHSFLCKTRGIDMGIENVLTTSGAQMAIYIAASLLIKRGDKVAISEPTFSLPKLYLQDWEQNLSAFLWIMMVCALIN